MRKKTLIAMAVTLVALLGVGTAYGLTLHAGDLVISAEGGFSPRTLPRTQNAPITIYGGGKIGTASGALPPILQTLDIEFDRHGSVVTTGLPVCTKGKLEATTTAVARRKCAGSIVGEGQGSAIVKFPEQAPIKTSSPITLFNGPPKGGDPTVLAHAYLSVPAPTTYIIPVVIETIHRGLYGYRTKATIPKIAGGAGIPVSGSLRIGKKWTYKGRQYSYVNARCESGRLQAKADFSFNDGTFLTGTFLKTCAVRK